MVKRTGPQNYQLLQLLRELEPSARESSFWRRVVEDLKKPTRQRREINVYTLNASLQKGEIALVPGKVLSLGQLDKKIEVAALNFSAEARRKIEQAQGKTMTIGELFQQNPAGKGVRILG